MINYYIVSIKGKNPKKILHEIFKLNVNLIDIKYSTNSIVFKISYDDYLRVKQIKTIYEINIIGICGIKKILYLIKQYYIFVIFFVFSILVSFFVTNSIFFIKIDSNNQEIINLLNKELNDNNIALFSFKKSYSSLNEICNKIRIKNKDRIEWLSLSYDGVYLYVSVIERVKSDIKLSNDYTDIVAEKNGYIRDIYSTSGEIIKIKGDYVKKGDIIVSGNIYRNDKVIGKTSAKADVYAEVWYNVKLKKSLSYIKKEPSKKGYISVSINILNKKINLFKIKKAINNNKTINIFKSSLMTVSLDKKLIYTEKIEKYSYKYLLKYLEKLAALQIKKQLNNKEYIIIQKTLKNHEENGNIYVEVFFKVYENIAKEVPIAQIEEKEE